MRRPGIGTQTTSVRPRQLGVDRRPTCPVSWGGRSTGFSRAPNGSPAWGAAGAAPPRKIHQLLAAAAWARVFARKAGRTIGVVKNMSTKKEMAEADALWRELQQKAAAGDVAALAQLQRIEAGARKIRATGGGKPPKRVVLKLVPKGGEKRK